MDLLKVRDVAAKEVEQFYFKMGRPINIESVLAEFEKISPIIINIKISILDNFTWVDDQYQKMIDQGRKHEVITECQEQYDSCSLRLMSEDGFYNSMNDPRESLIELNIRCYDAFAKEFSHQYLALQSETKVKEKKLEQETPKTFDELFYNADLVTPCVDILKELDPPLIDTDCNYIGRLKGIICVWIDEMQRQGIVKSNYPEERKLLASLIPQKIKRFSIDESMFGKYQSKAENLYRTDIMTKVSNINLSQNSHKESREI